MTVDPQDVVDRIARSLHNLAVPDPPALLGRSIEPPPRLPPVRQSDEVQALHRGWEELVGTGATARQLSVAGKVRARVTSVAADLGLASRQRDRALLGDLIRAVDALAARVDQLADRLAAVETVLPELVTALGEDLVRLRAALENVPVAADSSDGDPPASTAAHDSTSG